MKKSNSIMPNAFRNVWHILALILLIMLAGDTTVEAQTKPKKKPPRHVATSPPITKSGKQLSYEIFPAAQNSFGYNILSGNKKLVHQPSIPGLPGNKGFTRKEDAEKCAQLVVNKINNNIMPPTVTRQELDSLKIKL
jgi:hypothetical protein